MSSLIGRVITWLVLAALLVVAAEAIVRTNPLTGTNSVGRATKARESSAPRREPVQLDAERPLPNAMGVRAVMPLGGEVIIADKTGLLTRLRPSTEGSLTTVAQLQLTGEPVRMSREDDRLFVAASWGGAYRVSAESTMALDGHWQTSALSRATAPFDGTLLVADWNAGVAVLAPRTQRLS